MHTVARRATTPATRPSAHRIAAQHAYGRIKVDDRCGMELDETDLAVWLKLEAATEEFIQKKNTGFKDVCEFLVPRYQEEDKSSRIVKSLSFSRLSSSNSGMRRWAF